MFSDRKILTFLLVLVLFLGVFLRLYRLEDTLMFQGDQGRDVIVVKQIIKDADLTLLGPTTSVGKMFLGPFYYYVMSPFLALSYPNPAGPAYGVALMSILTLVLLFIWGREIFNNKTGLIATSMMSVSLIAVEYGRFSWNPNPAPLLTLIIYWACYRALSLKKYQYFLLASLTYGLLVQLHHVTLLMGGVILFSGLYALWTDKEGRGKIFLYSLFSLLLFIYTWTPLIVFNIRHNDLIGQGFKEFFSGHESHLSLFERIFRMVWDIEDRAIRILGELSQSTNIWVSRLIVISSIFLLGIMIYLKKLKIKGNVGLILLIVWLLTGILGTTLYSDVIYDHYLLYLLPGIYLFFGMLLEKMWSWNTVGKVVVVGLIFIFGWINLIDTPALAKNSGPSAKHFEKLVAEMLPLVPEGSYNIALITESKDYRGMNYRYFFEVSNKDPNGFEDYENIDYLIIIDELRVEDPFELGLYEIQTPGLTSVKSVTEIKNGPRVYIVGEEE